MFIFIMSPFIIKYFHVTKNSITSLGDSIIRLGWLKPYA